ncbi:type II toxin-antitoxin system VapC family toxin [soil metagenome]|jgi:PIN domain nuclease of toxin-antitoxin system
MRILLDTHVVLWALTDPARLGRRRELVADPDATRMLSAVVVWEVAIKVGLGRLHLGASVGDWAWRARRDLQAESVAISEAHVAGVADLPHHHRDPFGRLLVAQARHLGVPIVTADRLLSAYDVEVLDLT